MKIQESGENYLETILLLFQKTGVVRSIDIANEMEFSKPSVSRAMSILKEAGFITIETGGGILLTQSGLCRAQEIYERHCIITHFLEITLGIEHGLADKDACRIEHILGAETFEEMKRFVRKSEEANTRNDWEIRN